MTSLGELALMVEVAFVLGAERDRVVDHVDTVYLVLARESRAHVVVRVSVSAWASILKPPEGVLDL